MIKVKLKDKEGHGYWLYEDGQFVLALKEKPSVGVQFKTIAWLKKGIYSARHLNWNKEHSCWYIARLPLLKTTSFGIRIIYVEETVDDTVYKGFVHPRVLTSRDKQWHSTGYEKQLKLLPKDLKKTKELAEEFWNSLAG
jgi:hypothetical protein